METWREALDKASIIAVDLETSPWRCFGFATTPQQSYVIPIRRLDLIREVCAHPVAKVGANFKFDLFVLKYLWNVEVKGEIHDVMAQWFSLYPEIAGKGEKGAKATRKSLAFLSSIFTYDAYWKGDYSTEEEFYEYNGKDCCITLDVFQKLQAQIEQNGAEGTYEHIRKLIWPCVDMLHRGLNVDDDLRIARMSQLKTKSEELKQELKDLVEPLLQEVFLKDVENQLVGKRSSGINWNLFNEKPKKCKCCRNAKKKMNACWSCAGFAKAPTKKQLKEQNITLSVCTKCNGIEEKSKISYNPRSHDQNKIVLYDILRLPKRMKAGVLSSDENALKSLLGQIQRR